MSEKAIDHQIVMVPVVMVLYRLSRGKCKELREKRFGLNRKGFKIDGWRKNLQKISRKN